ncbi:hypothetical protein LIER_28268 [Lithospermum erythrorhizon]|uniref:Uncharacterized protein n=1 Tax=Lithospermum erythrorhizon TaxID=34254 RepID=A0AAV3RF31_LITER
MASGEVRRVSRQDIQLVQNLIERCLQLYMSQREVVNTLLQQAKIEPGFTELVWQKLEEENQEFFRAYYFRLVVKDQIMRFNQLLERQVELMRQICPSGPATIPMSNGAKFQSMHQNSICHPLGHARTVLKTENTQPPINPNISNMYSNGASLQPCLQTTTNMPPHVNRIGLPSNMLSAQTSNTGIMHGMNGGMIKSEAGFPANSSFIFGSDNNGMDSRSTIGDAPVSSFGNMESNSRPSNETIIDAAGSSFGFLGQIPRNFSLSDLTADFSNSSDILGSYSRSPFLATDPNNFLDPQGGGEQQDIEKLDTISEGLSYEDFTSD